MSKLTLIRGLPGSGKSTMARAMVDFHQADVCIEADDWLCFESQKDGYGFALHRPCQYHWTKERARMAHARCQTSARALLRAGETVVVSNTFTQAWEMQPYLNMANDIGAQVEIITATGDYGSIHNVPDDVIQAMRERWEEVAV